MSARTNHVIASVVLAACGVWTLIGLWLVVTGDQGPYRGSGDARSVGTRSRPLGARAITEVSMRSHLLARRGGIGLGVTYVVLGVAETVRLAVTGDGGFLFWFGTLVGGGTLVLIGSLPSGEVRGGRRLVAVLLGAAIGIPATAWTLVVPLLAITVIVLTVMSQSDLADPASERPLGERR